MFDTLTFKQIKCEFYSVQQIFVYFKMMTGIHQLYHFLYKTIHRFGFVLIVSQSSKASFIDNKSHELFPKSLTEIKIIIT